ncbi:MAG TPA: ROK family protein [Ruminiclostridium sp.]
MAKYVASHLKDMNRKIVYKLISSIGEISRAEISRQTGISSPTVLKITNFLLQNDFIKEAGEGISHIGRKPQILKFNPSAAYSIGVDFEGDFLKIGIVDLIGNVKAFKQIRVSGDFDEIISKKLYDYIEDIINNEGISKNKILGIGLGIPGAIDVVNCIVEFAPLVGIYTRRECKVIIDELSSKSGLPVFLENDANAAAIGEYITRKLSPKCDLAYLSLGTGLGAGLILNGKIRRGIRNSAGEIGYMVFDKDYHTYKSKAGWLESRINFQALTEKWEIYKSIETEDKIEDFKNSKDFILLVDYVASYLGMCIANLNALLDLDMVVIGGVSTKRLGLPLIESVKQYMSKLRLLDIECELQSCEEPGIVGAASISTNSALDKLLVD